MSYIDEDLSVTHEAFFASKDTAKDIVTVLKCLLSKDKAKTCSMVITDEGIQVVVDEKANMQWNAYFKRNVFTDYDIRVGTIYLRLPLHDLMEAINALSPQAKVEFRYKEDGAPFVINVQHENSRLTVAIKSFNAQNILDFDFGSDAILAKVLLLPKTIKDVIRDIDSAPPTVRFKITQNEFEISYHSELLKASALFPNYSREVAEIMVKDEIVSFHYKATLIKRLLPALRATGKVGIRINERGILSVQFPILQEDKQTNFVEFYCVPDLDETEIL